MPTKPAKMFKKKAYKKKAYKKKGVATSQLVYYDNSRLNPYPRRYITKIHSGVFGAVPVGQSQGTWSIITNGRLPYAGSGLPSGTVPNVSALGGTGFNNLCNANFYRYYRVTGFKIKFEFIPQALTDTVLATITPSMLSNIPAIAQQAMTQPYTVKGNFSSSKNNMNSKRGSAITLSVKNHEFLGTTKELFNNALDPSFVAQYNSTPTRPIHAVFNWQTLDNVITATPLEFRIELTQYMQFYEQDTANLNQIAP